MVRIFREIDEDKIVTKKNYHENQSQTKGRHKVVKITEIIIVLL